MEVTLNIEMPNVISRRVREIVTCGECEVVIYEVGSDHRTPRLSGGGTGDWIPEYDWRDNYVLEDKLRRGFALPYRTIHNLAVEEVKKREKARLISEAAKTIGDKVFA